MKPPPNTFRPPSGARLSPESRAINDGARDFPPLPGTVDQGFLESVPEPVPAPEPPDRPGARRPAVLLGAGLVGWRPPRYREPCPVCGGDPGEAYCLWCDRWGPADAPAAEPAIRAATRPEMARSCAGQAARAGQEKIDRDRRKSRRRDRRAARSR